MSTDQLSPNAWLLDFGQGFHAAVGTRVLLQLIDQPCLHQVPCTPPHCQNVLRWQGKLLPVMDMAALLGGAPLSVNLLAVAAYQDKPADSTRFVAFRLASPPAAIIVGDEQSCALPVHPSVWAKFAISCFGHRGEAIPIPNLERIFSAISEP